MDIEKDKVVEQLRAKGDHDRAQMADCALPQNVDTERDAGLLHTFDVNVSDLTDPDADAGAGAEPTAAEPEPTAAEPEPTA